MSDSKVDKESTDPESLAAESKAADGKSFSWAIGLLVVVAIAAGVYFYVSNQWNDPDSNPKEEIANVDIPKPDTTQMSPQSIAIMNTAYNAVQDSPDDGDAWGKLGMGFYAHENNNEAIVCFEQAERLSKENPKWPYLLGMVVAETDVANGIGAIERATQLDPDDHEIRIRLAEFYYALDLFEKSEKELDLVHKKDSGNPRVNLGLARLAFSREDWGKARYLCEQALFAAPMRPDILELISRACHRDGDSASANKYAQQLNQVAGGSSVWSDKHLIEVMSMRTDIETMLEQASHLEAANRVQDSLELLDQVVRSNPTNAEGFIQFGQALLRAQRFEVCARVVEAALKEHPKNSEIIFLKAVTHLQLKETDDAIKTMKEAIALKPDYFEAWFVLGNVYLKMDDKVQAANAFQNVLRYEPAYQPARDALKALEN